MYTCPMHPEVRETGGGMCPQCGMNLVQAGDEHQEHQSSHGNGDDGGHSGHAGHGNVFKRKFWVTFALAIPILAYSPLPTALIGWSAPAFPYSWLISPVFGTIVFFYGGWVFVESAYRELRGRAPGMMTLISLAIITAFVYSIYQVLIGEEQTLFWELASLIVVMLLGHWMEMRAVQSAQGALTELSALLPKEAERIQSDGTIESVPLEQLTEGDTVMIRPGGKIPADGEVVEGTSDVNEALATGEAEPVEKQSGDQVIGGTINGNGSLRVRVTGTGEDTFLAGVMRLVKQAQASKSKLQLVSDRAAYYLTIVAVAAGLLAFFGWIFVTSDAGFALERLVAVLVIACPHALGLAIPLVASISTHMAASNGLLVRERRALEAARNVDVVLFDKTGTLTTGDYGVTDIYAYGDFGENDVLALAAAVDAASEHTVARAIVSAADERDIDVPEVSDFERLPGKGVRGNVNGQDVRIGGASLIADRNVPDALDEQLSGVREAGKTIVYVLAGKYVAGAIALGDTIRPQAREAVTGLTSQGIEVAMVTGDSEAVAQWVADELGIGTFFAEVLPKDKAHKVKELQKQDKHVAMVGDGINDAPALVQADVGIAIGAGTNVAVESAGIILVRNDPRDIPKIIRLSNLTYSKMVQNLWWASGYNIVAIPLAGGIAASWGIVLNPAFSAILMSVSTVIVAVNAVLLRRQDLGTVEERGR